MHWNNHPKAHVNLSVDQLLTAAQERKEGVLAKNGALSVATGKYTGRSPDDRFFVKEPSTQADIDWGKTNKPISEEVFDKLLEKITAYLKEKDVFIHDGYACADPARRFPVKVVSEFAWHNIFAAQLFLRYKAGEKIPETPAMTVIAAPRFKADPSRDETNSEAFIILNFKRRIVLIGGTEYAGEIKKSIFTTLNFLLPKEDILPMHCSANLGKKEDVALFFGLSGTGKTTLSADPHRRLIGDDEHAWDEKGIFNLEGGCYAKTIRLSEKYEPEIWHAVKKGAVLENVVLKEDGTPDYDDGSLTENTRVGYPLEHIPNIVSPSVGGHPKVVFFLTADAFGVLPPVAKLTPEEAMFHFLSGYTAKLAGTERGVKDPKATFSSCFGSPFLPRSASFYGEMFKEKTAKYDVPVYLINTGWSGGPFGVGKRISLPHTRAIIDACIDGALNKAVWTPKKEFRLSIPSECPGVPSEILNPIHTWEDKSAYQTQAAKLVALFEENYTKLGR